MSYHCSLSAIQAPSGGRPGKFPAYLLQKLRDLEIPQRWTTADEMVRELSPQHSWSGNWRLCRCYIGMIRGLPSTRGTIIAKRGVNCLIFREDETLFIGHSANFLIEGWDYDVEE